MSAKLNFLGIVISHFKTLKHDKTECFLLWDWFSFVLIPLMFSIISIIFSWDLDKDKISLLINFGSIFTALLLSVLVLVYEQENKLETHKSSTLAFEIKKKLLNQLYSNICFAIIASLLLVVVSFLHEVIHATKIDFINVYIFTPVIILLVVNVVLTIFMIVKRMHILLTA